MPILNAPGPGEKLRQNYNLNQPYDGTLGPEIVPVVMVDDFSRNTVDERSGAVGYVQQGAVAAEFPVCSMTCPAGGQRMHITRAILRVSVGTAVIMNQPLSITGLTRETQVNWRYGGKAGVPSAFVGRGSSGALTIVGARPMWDIWVPAGTAIVTDLDFWINPLPPAGTDIRGRGVYFTTLVPNVTLTISWFWDEIAEAG